MTRFQYFEVIALARMVVSVIDGGEALGDSPPSGIAYNDYLRLKEVLKRFDRVAEDVLLEVAKCE